MQGKDREVGSAGGKGRRERRESSQTRHRGESHRTIHRLASFDGGDRRARAEMHGDETHVRWRLAEMLSCGFEKVRVREAVEAVPPDSFLAVRFVREPVQICLHGFREGMS